MERFWDRYTRSAAFGRIDRLLAGESTTNERWLADRHY
jgi:hypothetical protein